MEPAQQSGHKKVRGVDTSETYEFASGYLTYHRETHVMKLTRKPVLRKFYREDTVSSDEKTGRRKSNRVDTLEIRAKVIIYNDSMRIAKAKQNVTITRGNLIITCENAVFYEKTEQIHLEGNPVSKLQDNVMSGDKMILTLDGEKLRNIALKGNAKGDYSEKKKDSLSMLYTDTYHLEGDSLYMEFKDEAMEYIEIFKKGLATYFKSDHPDKLNKMNGEFLRLDFVEDKIDSALVIGKAKSTYFHFEDYVYQGKNMADGDTISISFDLGKIKDIYIMNGAKGTYFEQPGKKTESEKGEAENSK
jgi:lipopolysaccharide export system protein LptA